MPKTFADFINEARSRTKEIDVHGAAAAIDAGGVTVIDVREPEEYARGCIQGAINIPRGVAEMGVPQMVPDRGTRIIFYCAGGGRSLLAADALRQMGYESVESMTGGYQAWTQSGYKSAR